MRDLTVEELEQVYGASGSGCGYGRGGRPGKGYGRPGKGYGRGKGSSSGGYGSGCRKSCSS